MNKSILLASLVAVAALTACSKKEPEVTAPPAPVVEAPASAVVDAASAAASAAVDAASAAVDAASAASK